MTIQKSLFLQVSPTYALKLRQNGNTRRLLAYLVYLFDVDYDKSKSARVYAKEWNVGKSTSHRWLQEFKNA